MSPVGGKLYLHYLKDPPFPQEVVLMPFSRSENRSSEQLNTEEEWPAKGWGRRSKGRAPPTHISPEPVPVPSPFSLKVCPPSGGVLTTGCLHLLSTF